MSCPKNKNTSVSCDLSIITITKDSPQQLEKTFRSLVPCNFGEHTFEHIVIDDSPVLDHKVYSILPPSWPLKRHSSPHPSGIYNALNFALSMSQGEYVWILHGGDELFNQDLLLKSLKALKSGKVSNIGFGERIMKQDKFQYVRRPHRFFLFNLLGTNSMSHLGCILSAKTYQSIFSKDKEFYSTNFPIAADYLFFWNCYLNHISIQFERAPLVNFDLGGASSNWRSALFEFRKIHKLAEEQAPSPQRYAYRVGNSVFWHLDLARYYLFRVLKKLPSSSLQNFMTFIWKNVLH